MTIIEKVHYSEAGLTTEGTKRIVIPKISNYITYEDVLSFCDGVFVKIKNFKIVSQSRLTLEITKDFY